jgi:hypothetical protein
MAVCSKPVRVTYAVEPRSRDQLFGPFGLRFQVLVKVGDTVQQWEWGRAVAGLFWFWLCVLTPTNRAPAPPKINRRPKTEPEP